LAKLEKRFATLKSALKEDPWVDRDKEAVNQFFDKDPVAALVKLIYDSGTARYRGANALEQVRGKAWKKPWKDLPRDKSKRRLDECVKQFESIKLPREDAELWARLSDTRPTTTELRLWKEIQDTAPTDEELAEMVQAYKNHMDLEMPCLSCACCGVREFVPKDEEHTAYPQVNITDLPWYMEVSPTDSRLKVWQCLPPEHKAVVGITEHEGRLYNLHPWFTNTSEGTTRMCERCSSHVKSFRGSSASRRGEESEGKDEMEKRRKLAPAYSLAAGYDYGNPVALGLEPLAAAESLLVGLVRPDMVVVKFTPSGNLDLSQVSSNQMKLRGHVVSFDQDGPRELAKHLPDVEAITSVLRVWFVGPRGRLDKWREGVLACDGLTVDCGKVVKWLQVLKIINPHYEHVKIRSDVAKLKGEVDSALEHVWETAEWSTDDEAIQLEQSACSDVANVRHHDDTTSGITTSKPFVEPVFITSRPTEGVTDNAGVLKAYLEAVGPKPPKTGNDVRVERGPEPVSEFDKNNELLYQAFPHVFLLGKGLPRAASLSVRHASNLLQQFTCAAAHEPRLVFPLFNQSQRHAAIRDVNVKARNHPDAFEKCTDFVSRADFQETCKKAEADPKGPEAKVLFQELGKVLRVTGGHVGDVANCSKQQARIGSVELTALTVGWHGTGPVWRQGEEFGYWQTVRASGPERFAVHVPYVGL